MSEQPNCYKQCNQLYTAVQPGRLYCKKGCDNDDQELNACKNTFCNKLCIKQQQDDPQKIPHFLYRAPVDPSVCLQACIFGCMRKTPQQKE